MPVAAQGTERARARSGDPLAQADVNDRVGPGGIVVGFGRGVCAEVKGMALESFKQHLRVADRPELSREPG